MAQQKLRHFHAISVAVVGLDDTLRFERDSDMRDFVRNVPDYLKEFGSLSLRYEPNEFDAHCW